MTDVEQVREWLAQTRALCEAATPGPWVDDWWFGDNKHPESYAVRGDHATIARTDRLKQGWCDAVYIAAASPDRMLRLVTWAEDVLDRHYTGSNPDPGCWCDDELPCPEVAAVLRAWAP